MNKNIFIPKKIKVGFQSRSDTYSKKLAYIIYYDEKNKLRKETSFNKWIDKNIPTLEFDNEPTEGFVLNKKVGGNNYDYNPRQTYVRVYDPRGFEFEITIPNLLHILENSVCNKGKGLEGTFVYSYSGTELLLLPTQSPNYKSITQFSEALHNQKKITAKNLIPGATYKFTNGKTYVYLEKSNLYENNQFLLGTNKGKHFYFVQLDYNNNIVTYHSNWNKYIYFPSYKTLPKIAVCLNETPTSDYPELMDKLQNHIPYMDPDKHKLEKIPYTFEEFKDFIKKNPSFNYNFIDNNLKEIRIQAYNRYSTTTPVDELTFKFYNEYTYQYVKEKTYNIKQCFDKIQPIKIKIVKK